MHALIEGVGATYPSCCSDRQGIVPGQDWGIGCQKGELRVALLSAQWLVVSRIVGWHPCDWEGFYDTKHPLKYSLSRGASPTLNPHLCLQGSSVTCTVKIAPPRPTHRLSTSVTDVFATQHGIFYQNSCSSSQSILLRLNLSKYICDPVPESHVPIIPW